MKCFNHPTVDAVALCKSCARALCRDCATEVNKSCCCRNRCESEVALMHDLLVRGSQAYIKTSATYLRTGILTVLLGAVVIFVGTAMLLSDELSIAGYAVIVFGVLFSGLGISYLVSAKRFKQK
ncbi:MAG: hypothetical protein NTY01_01855 [Verrucomicrobia bacterium]|nr:hypothetical protein [Verrucomicrobiota bacterium]